MLYVEVVVTTIYILTITKSLYFHFYLLTVEGENQDESFHEYL